MRLPNMPHVRSLIIIIIIIIVIIIIIIILLRVIIQLRSSFRPHPLLIIVRGVVSKYYLVKNAGDAFAESSISGISPLCKQPHGSIPYDSTC